MAESIDGRRTPGSLNPRALRHARCFNHAGREAVARCPRCRHFFCRECVSEHDTRYLCARCLAEAVDGSGAARGRGQAVVAAFRLAAGLIVIWLLFALVGRALVTVPGTFHDADDAAAEAPLEEEPAL